MKLPRRVIWPVWILYGTEVVDLPMVSTIGELMRRFDRQRNLPWVNIHGLRSRSCREFQRDVEAIIYRRRATADRRERGTHVEAVD